MLERRVAGFPAMVNLPMDKTVKGIFSARMLVYVALIAGFAMGAQAEILSKDGFGARSEYLDRIRTLTTVMTETPLGEDHRRRELRTLAVTLSSALQDMLFNEAAARQGKVAAPPTLLRPAQTDAGSKSEKGELVAIEAIPSDWLLQQGGMIKSELAALIAALENDAVPLSSGTVSDAIRRTAIAVADLDRPQ